MWAGTSQQLNRDLNLVTLRTAAAMTVHVTLCNLCAQEEP